MTAATVTLIQELNAPSTIRSGTAEKRLVHVYVEATSAGADGTLDLATYLPGLQGILAVQGNSLDAADASNDGTLNTWSGTTITFAGHAGSGVWKLLVLANY